MNRNLKRLSWLLALVLAAGVMVVGCAEERDPIDRVQPYALDKTFFLGEDLVDDSDNPEFWTQATLVDVGYGAKQDGLFTSTYAQLMGRMHWYLTEDYLIGRASYERIDGTDGKGVGGRTDEGVIVAVFRVEKHFDIRNSYNPVTGEKYNIVEENASDRPWYQRQYMRVDFSKNLNTDSYDFDTLSLMGIYGSIQYEPLSYFVEDPRDEDAPVFDFDNGYFDVTTKAFAKPGEVDLSHLGWGIDSFPACYLENDFMGGSAPNGSCSPVELTFRHSFRRVVESDFEPNNWDGFRFQAYGAFTVERLGYTRKYGMTDEQWHQFITRYDIWEQSHYYDANDNPVECFTPETTPYGGDPHRDVAPANGTEDECEAVGNGSRCNEYTQKCTLPFQDRVPKATIWYYTTGSNPEFYEASAIAAHYWDVALRSAVNVAKYAECRNVGGTQEDCAARFPVWFGQQTDNQDAVDLAMEVDDCRAGIAYAGEDCDAVADRVGAARGYTTGVIETAKMAEMIILCHSPVEAGDHELCTPNGEPRLPAGVTAEMCYNAREGMDVAYAEGVDALLDECSAALNVRMGDLRYNQINGIVTPQTPSPWGIYTDAEDPLTGETISVSVNVWTFVNDLWSQKMIDVVRYIKGELQTEDITEGTYVKDWAQLAESASKNGVLPKMTAEQVADRMASYAKAQRLSEAPNAVMPEAIVLPDSIKAQAKRVMMEARNIRASATQASSMSAVYSARREQAKGTEFEAKLMNKALRELNGVDGFPMTEGMMDYVSPLRGGNPTMQRDFEIMKQNALAEHGSCVMYEAQTPMAMAGMADILEKKFQAQYGPFNPNDPEDVQLARAEAMRKYISRRAHMSVIVHEMGHSVGMRHNFVSSSDAYNFRPQYWQLRTDNGTIDQLCTTLDATGEDCVGPRWFDPITENEQKNLLEMWMHSSVMEYAGESTQDFLGLGAYDFATARMFYGDAVAVYDDPMYAVGTPQSTTIFDKIDNFGGTIGIRHDFQGEAIHYSQLQEHFDLIQDCQVVEDPTIFRPARYNADRDGTWDPTFDGYIVSVDGVYSRCRQPKVDYVRWDNLRKPTEAEFANVEWIRGSNVVDDQNRIRVPYGFATDGWADLGNLSVYRHDNGADAYEIFDFLITQQEIWHIFDNYRRGRYDFSLRSAQGRTLGRYNTKIRDGAKGLGLMRGIYKTFSLNIGEDFDLLWPTIASQFFPDNILASGMVFDHFARTMARPQSGPHFKRTGEVVLRSFDDQVDNLDDQEVLVTVPNGATGKWGDISPGGKLVENRLSENFGEFDSRITVNCGSYYDKMNAAMLMTESVDNFISDSRQDFVDGRYRAVSMADLFPEGYRRFIGNMLTGDDWVKGARVASERGRPVVDKDGYPEYAIGWTSWWGDEAKSCFPSAGTTVCGSYATDPTPFQAEEITDTAVLDPQVGWEVQKFIIAWTLLYLPENEQQTWLNMMRVWELGVDADPEFTNRIELHHPNGKIYVARTYGRENVLGRDVQRGIAARMLEWGNWLLAAAYEVEDGPDLDGDGFPDWYIPVYDEDTGMPIVRYDPSIGGGLVFPQGRPGCNSGDFSGCTCSSNRSCVELESYMEVPFYLRQALDAYGLAEPSKRGIYD